MTYPSSLVAAAAQRATEEDLPPTLSPLDYVLLDSGLLAHGSAVLNRDNLQGPDGKARERVTLVLFFDRNDFAPANYAKWVENSRGKANQTRKRVREEWKNMNEDARKRYLASWQSRMQSGATQR